MKQSFFGVCVAALLLPAASNGQELKGRRFEDVSAKAGVVTKVRPLGAALIDLDGDGFLDILVNGKPRPLGLGVAFADFDNDGRPDLYVVNDGRIDLYVVNGARPIRGPVIESIKVEGGKVEITGQSIKIEGGKVEILRRRR